MKPVFTFAKKIKDATTVRVKDITDDRDVSKLDHVIGRLDALPRIGSLPLSETGLSTNPKRWVASLLEGYPDRFSREDAESLLHDFTDSMKTRMREESKHALALLMDCRLLLCHSIFGEETITPEWKTIPRMLDADNILRYVCFSRVEGVIHVKYWEREATSSFVEWLGLPRKQAFLFGGKYRMICEIDGVTTELQLSEEEIDRWLSLHPELKDGEIRLANPILCLAINEIRSGQKRYSDPAEFIQDFNAEKYGVPVYQKHYQRIKSAMLPLLVKYYDERTQLVRKEGEEETVELAKATPDFDIIFADGDIELRATYSADLVRRLVNGETIRAFHAGAKFSTAPFVLGGLHLFNELTLTPAAIAVHKYYSGTNLQDRTLDLLFKAVILALVASSSSPSPLRFLCQVLRDGIVTDAPLQGRLTKLEDSSIEYKSQDILRGKEAEVHKSLADDLASKLAVNPVKVYIIGAEDSGRLDPIHASRLRSDRIDGMKKALQERLPGDFLYVVPAIQEEDGLLLVVAIRPALAPPS